MAPPSPTQKLPDEAARSGGGGVFERIVSAGGYFFAGVGIAAALGLGLAIVLLQDMLGSVLAGVMDSGLGGAAAIVGGVLIVGGGIGIGRRLAQGREPQEKRARVGRDAP